MVFPSKSTPSNAGNGFLVASIFVLPHPVSERMETALNRIHNSFFVFFLFIINVCPLFLNWYFYRLHSGGRCGCSLRSGYTQNDWGFYTLPHPFYRLLCRCRSRCIYPYQWETYKRIVFETGHRMRQGDRSICRMACKKRRIKLWFLPANSFSM